MNLCTLVGQVTNLLFLMCLVNGQNYSPFGIETGQNHILSISSNSYERVCSLLMAFSFVQFYRPWNLVKEDNS